MTPSPQHIRIEDIEIDIIKKNIKNAYIRIDPSNGRIQVTAPIKMSQQTLMRSIEGKLGWIKKRSHFLQAKQQAQSIHYSDGEQHYFQGRPYQLKVYASHGTPYVRIEGATMSMYVMASMSTKQRKQLVEAFYKKYLTKILPQLFDQWQQRLNEKAHQVRIRAMKTRWGSCSPTHRRISINLRLAKYAVEALEYVVVHELIHFKETGHNKRFYDFMDHYLPDWRQRKEALKSDAIS